MKKYYRVNYYAVNLDVFTAVSDNGTDEILTVTEDASGVKMRFYRFQIHETAEAAWREYLISKEEELKRELDNLRRVRERISLIEQIIEETKRKIK